MFCQKKPTNSVIQHILRR